MTTENIFGNDILNGELTTSLVPELGSESILIDTEPSEISLIDPLTQELSLTETEILIDENENSIDNNSAFNNNPSINNLVVSNIDPFTGGDVQEFQVNEISASNALFTPPIDELQLQGGFGDYDGGDDVTFEVKNDDEVVVETYSLTGKGQASLYRDDEDGKAYVFFSGTDESTSVEISAKSNIQFGGYIGDSLKIETTGSIDAGSVTLSNPDETGLVLKSGIQGGDETLEVLGYDAVHLGEGTAKGINNEGEVVVDGYGASLSYIYSDGEINYLGSDNSITPNEINDSGQVVGSFTSSDNNTHAFVSSGGSISDLGVLPGAETYEIYDGSGFVEVPYDSARSFGNAINNNGQIVGTASSKFSWGFDQFRWHAFISDGGSMTNLQSEINSLFGYHDDFEENPDAYWFYASNANGINDLGQVVGSHFYEYDEAFVYGGGQNINLHSLLGDDVRSSSAHDINNNGQIIGSFTTRRYGSGFVYNDGEIKTLGGSLLDINNNGIVVGSSGATAMLHDINNDTSINLNIDSTIDSEEAIWLRSAGGINDKGQIAATGYFTSNASINNAFLLNPQFADPELDDYINIGKISTFGDTVLLQGNEIILTGNVITTTGGEITFDGATTVNGNLTIDSSVTEESVITDGGDITFTNTVDGSQNLTLKAGTGNILFSDVVGSNATFSNVAVEGAGSVTINNDLAINGNLSLEVINDITTANLSAAGLVNISLGKVGDEIYPSTGNVTTGNIDALGLEVLNNGNFTAGDLTTTDGDINVISLNQLNVGQLTATNGAIDLISGTAGITVNGTVQGDNGFIALAQQDIVTNEITSSQDAVILKSSQGAVTVNDSVTAFGDASIAAAGNVTVSAVTSNDESVALISATGMVNLGGAVSSMEDVTVASAQSLNIDQEIKAELGSIALGSTEGSVTASVPIDTAIGVNIAAKQNVSTKRIRTYGGNVVVDAEQGTATIGGKINSRGGDVLVSASGRVRTKNIISRSGDVSVISDSGLVRTGYIRTDRGNRSGDVYLEAARNIRVGAAVEIDGEQYSIYAGDDGVINVAYQQNKKENKRGQFVIGDTTGSGTLNEVYGQYAFLDGEPGPKPPNPIWLIIKGIIDSLTSSSSPPARPPVVVDINPITGKPYVDDAERELVRQLTLEQDRELRKIINSRDPKFAPYIPNDLLNRGRVDTRMGCFSSELSGHLGSNPIFSPNIPPEIVEAAGQYATRVSGSPNDYLVINKQGVAAYYDGLVNETGAAASVIPNIAGMPRVVETKYGYSFLNKFIKPEDQLPAGFNRFPGLTHNPTSPTRTQQRIYRDMKDELEREALVAETCLLNYAAIFSNQQAYGSASELFSFPQTRETSQFIPVYRIRASA